VLQHLKKVLPLQQMGGEILLGMRGGAVNPGEEQQAVVRLERMKRSQLGIRKPKRLISRIYSYSITHSTGPVTIQDPFLWLSIQWDTDAQTEYVLKQWNTEERKWQNIPARVNTDNHTVSATVTTPTGIFAVFRKKKNPALTGIASYGSGWSGACMNDFPIGTKIEVENADTGAKITTTIVSTGPFVEGRIIDLSTDLFAQIGSLSAGLMNVIVRPIN